MMTLPGWTREPLVHFLVAGFALFVFLTWSSGGAVDPSSRVIAVDRERQAQLSLQFERTMGRAPTDAELATAIDRYVRDEVLYREGLRLGLDQDDAVVRRRLVTKMDLSASAAAEAAEPTEATLREYYKQNRERYREEVRVSFEQVFYGENGASAMAAARSLTRVDGVDVKGMPTSIPRSFDELPISEVEARFGQKFANSLRKLEPSLGTWLDLESGYGFHAVWLKAKEGGSVREFEAARNQVRNDWRSEEIAQRKERAFEVLREAYRVEVAE